MKTNRKELFLTTLVCLLPMAAGAAVYHRLPETMATHWGTDGAANGWMPRAAAVFALPALIAAIDLFCCWAMDRDPRKENMSTALRSITMWSCPAVSLLCGTITLGTGLGYEMHVSTVAPLFVGILFLVIGNYLPKTKQSDTLGIRLPWTLSSEENWDRTHRLTGFLWVAAGLLFLVLTLLHLWNAWLLSGLIVLATLLPLFYSYYLYRKGI